jgi:CRP-like cAMP-binding protein
MLRNLTLALLGEADLAALRPHLSSRHVRRGEMLTDQGGMVEHIYFPTTAYLANIVTFQDGRTAQTFIMGVEGVSGLAAFLAEEPCAWGVEVKVEGEVYQLQASLLRRQAEVSPQLRHQLLRRVYDYQAQAAFAVGCASLHPLTSRLALHILATSERLGADELHLTQQDLAAQLGVQRTSVSDAASELKAAEAITYSRGAISITDRNALIKRACECYELHQTFGACSPP